MADDQDRETPQPLAAPTEDQKGNSRSKRPSTALAAELAAEIPRLHQQGFGTRRIAKMLGIGRKQVRCLLESSALGSPTPQTASRPRPAKKLAAYEEAIRKKIELGLTTTRILREIRAEGYEGSRTILGDFVRKTRGSLVKSGVKRRFETGPALEMQVDWSTYQVEIAGKKRTVQAFAAVLKYSRKAFVRFFFDQRQPTLLEAHVMVFEDFEGVPLRCVYDRMATVVLGTIGRDQRPIWHPRFIDFFKHYGFDPFLCRARDPDRKGAVEAFIGYLEKDFVRGSSFASLEEMNGAVRKWLDDIANARVHGTTRRIPDEAFLEEKPFLIALPPSRYAACRQDFHRVYDDATMSVAGTPYSVPAHLAPGQVLVRRFAEHFEVLDARGVVVMSRAYVPESEKGRLVIDPKHYEDVRPRGQGVTGRIARMEARFLERFPDLAELLAGIKLRMKALFHVHLRALVRACERWGEARFLEAARKALHFRRFDAMAVLRMLERSHPSVEDEPIPPLGAEARLLAEIGEVDGGSLEDYAHLDQDPPNADDSASCTTEVKSDG